MKNRIYLVCAKALDRCAAALIHAADWFLKCGGWFLDRVKV